MKGLLWFGLGALVATVVITRITPANESSCCKRVAQGARDKIDDALGGTGVVGGILDGLGLTEHLPSVIDTFGVS